MTPRASVKPRVLVADDHDVVRRGLVAVLEAAGYEICGEAATGREAVDLAAKTEPDVAVLDVSMPDMNGLDAARRIVKARPATEVLVVTAHDSEDVVRGVLAAGARGYMLKSDAARDLVAAVSDLVRHRPHFTTRVADMVLSGYLAKGSGQGGEVPPAERLTPREREVVQLLAEGRSTKEIAAALSLSVKTIETHRANIMRTLGLGSLAELVRWAVRHRIVEA